MKKKSQCVRNKNTILWKLLEELLKKRENELGCVGLFRYFDCLSRYISIWVKGVTGKNINIFRHILVCHYLWNVLVKFHDNPSNLHTLYFRQNSNGRFWLVKFCQQLAPCPKIITPYKTANQWKKKQDFLVFMTTDHDFPGKASHCNTFFVSLSAVQFRTTT